MPDAAQIYDRFAPQIYRYLYHRLGQRGLAEDLTSEVFVRFIRARVSPDNIPAYLYRVAHNLAVDYQRRNPVVLGPLEEEFAAGRSDPAHLAQLEAERVRLRRAISRLTTDQQQVVVLKYLEGLSTAEVARIMEKPEGAVKALQHRAIGNLRQLLDVGESSGGRLEFAGLLNESN